MDKLREAARQALKDWDKRNPLDEAMNLMEEALAEQAEQKPVAIDELARACNLAGIEYKDFLRIKAHLPIVAPVQQEKQEPVAFKFPREPKPENAMGWTVDYGLIRDIAESIGDQEFHPGYEGIELTLIALERIYAAPVSAKREWVDLTDDEIWEAVKNWNLKERVEGNYSLTRAVIAAFKEKNK